jgi:hypothetical protein
MTSQFQFKTTALKTKLDLVKNIEGSQKNLDAVKRKSELAGGKKI